MPRYEEKDYHKALTMYRTLGRNISAVERQMGVSRPTLIGWKQSGYPVEVTDGRDWDMYLDEVDKAIVAEIKQREVLARIDDQRAFVSSEKERVRKMLDKVYDRILGRDGELPVEIKPADYDKLMRLYLMLDNQEQDKVLFMQNFIAKVIEIIADVVDEKQFALIKARFISMQQKERDKMPLLTGGAS
jgi:hypothetical protein